MFCVEHMFNIGAQIDLLETEGGWVLVYDLFCHSAILLTSVENMIYTNDFHFSVWIQGFITVYLCSLFSYSLPLLLGINLFINNWISLIFSCFFQIQLF